MTEAEVAAPRFRFYVASLAICVVFAVWATWPLARSLKTELPLGYEAVSTVPLFNAWTLWWNADRAAHGLADYWQAPIFSPAGGAFSFSEAQPTTMLVAPVVATLGIVAAYNLYLLASVALNGWLTLLLLRRLGLKRLPAWGGCVLMIVLPFVYWQMGVLQLIPLWGVLWTILELHRLSERPRSGSMDAILSGGRLGLAFGVTYLVCNYYGLFLSVLLTLSAPWLLGRRLLEGKTWAAIALGAITSGIVVGPVVAAQLRWTAYEEGGRRDSALVRELSAEPADYTTPVAQRWSRIPVLADAARKQTWRLSPGAAASLLAVLGMAWAAFRKARWSWLMFWGVFVFAAFCLSLGLKLQWRGVMPYEGLIALWPGFAQIRSPFRFGVFVQLGVVVLAAMGLQAVSDLLSLKSPDTTRDDETKRRWTFRGFFRTVIVSALAVFAVLENMPAAIVLSPAPDVHIEDDWAHWLKQHTDSNATIACLPFPAGELADDFLWDAESMFLQSVHQRRMIGGYSGFFPESYWYIEGETRDFPATAALDRLAEYDVAYCVVQLRRLNADQLWLLRHPPNRLKLVYYDRVHEISIHALDQPAAEADPPE